MTETTGAGELLESLDRHFLAGCTTLSTSQLAQHRERGSCEDCTEAAGVVARAAGMSSVPGPVPG